MNDFDFMNLLNDKSALLKYILNMIASSEKFTNGLKSMKERGWTQEGMLDKVVEISAIQSQQMKHLALVCLLLVQSREFDQMVASLAIKMGRGEEALNAMFDARLKGNF